MHVEIDNNHWRVLLQRGKQAFTEKAFEQSIDLNRQALVQIEQHFPTQFAGDNPTQAISLIFVCHLNCIDAHIALGQFSDANRLYGDCLDFLNTLNQSDVNTSQAASIAHCARNLYIEWSLFLKEHALKLANSEYTELQNLSDLFESLYPYFDDSH